MIHRMDPPADPTARADARQRSCRCSRALGRAARATTAAGRSRSSGTACARSPLRARRAAPAVAQPQRHHAALSRARAPQPRAQLAPRDPRRRDRRLRRRRPARASGRCSGACTSAPSAAARGWPRSTPVTYMIFDLLWLDGHSLMELPYAERRERLAELGLDAASAGRRPSTSSARARSCWRATEEQGLEGVVAKRLDSPLRAGPAQRQLAEDQERPAPGVRHRRLDAGRGPARASASARCSRGVHEDGGAALRRARRHRLQRGRARPPARAARAAAARRLAVRARRPEDRRAGRVFVEPRWSPRSSSASGPTAASCARRPTRACATTSPPSSSSARRRPKPVGRRRRARRCGSSNLDKVLYPDAGFTKRDVIDYYAARRARPAGAPRRARADAQALARRRRRQVFYEKQAPSPPARVGAHGERVGDRSTTSWSTTRRRSCGSPTSPTSSCTRRWRAAGRRRAPDARRLRPRPRRRRRPSSSAAASRCAARACSTGLGLQSFAKTSGSKGLQVYVPLNSPASRSRRPSRSRKAVAELLEQEEPELVVARRPRRARGQGARRLEPERRRARRRSTSTRCARRSARPSRRR